MCAVVISVSSPLRGPSGSYNRGFVVFSVEFYKELAFVSRGMFVSGPLRGPLVSVVGECVPSQGPVWLECACR